ncbi:MAG TPA: hypothetical protein VF472_03730 [Burkholderiaceae bacterium]
MQGRLKNRRGRPPRNQLSPLRAKIWAYAVEYAERRREIDLASIFAEDRNWRRNWDRYRTGVVSPSKQRVDSIAALLPGTDRYFYSPLWEILSNREYSNQELHSAASRLPPLIRRMLNFRGDAFPGMFWANLSNSYSLMKKARSQWNNYELVLDYFTALVLILRLAEQARDSRMYLLAMNFIADARGKLDEHPVLFGLPRWVFRDLVEPLRNIRFASYIDDVIWLRSKHNQMDRSRKRISNFDILFALDNIAVSEEAVDEFHDDSG